MPLAKKKCRCREAIRNRSEMTAKSMTLGAVGAFGLSREMGLPAAECRGSATEYLPGAASGQVNDGRESRGSHRSFLLSCRPLLPSAWPAELFRKRLHQVRQAAVRAVRDPRSIFLDRPKTVYSHRRSSACCRNNRTCGGRCHDAPAAKRRACWLDNGTR